VKHFKVGEGLADFIALEVAEKMPPRASGEEGYFGTGFLYTIFPENFDAQFHCFPQGIRGM
jgi:hypothetical protein